MLEELCNAFGVSGAEEDVREIIRREMRDKCDSMELDSMGNILCFKKGTKNYNNKIMLSCHMDEVGFIISGITEEGYLRFKTVGGIDSRILQSKKVVIGKNRVPGVIGAKPAHKIDKSKDDAVKVKDLYIDIGADSKEDAMQLVSLGDYAAFDSEYIEFGNQCIKAKALDDRIGCLMLLKLAEATYPNDLYFVFSVQEEVGCRGAAVAAYNIKPDYAIVVEGTTCSDVPGTNDHGFSTRLGYGPAISVLDSGSCSDKSIVAALSDTAKAHNITVQYKQTTMGSNDASAIHISGTGVKTGVLSVPCRYIHSPASVASKKDIKGCFQLLRDVLAKEEDTPWSY